MTTTYAPGRHREREIHLMRLKDWEPPKPSGTREHSVDAGSKLSQDEKAEELTWGSLASGEELNTDHLYNKKFQNSDDGQRLLRGSVQPIDPNAVPIPKPGSKFLRNNMGGIPTGIQPKNTLKQGTSMAIINPQDYTTEPQNSNRKKRSKILDLETSAGDNVISRAYDSEFALSGSGEPQAKRPKRKPSLNSDPISNHDEFNPITSDNLEYSVSHISRNEQELRIRGPPIRSRVSEYTKVEKIMDSNPRSRGRHRGSAIYTRGNTLANTWSLSRSSSPPKKNPSVILCDDELSERDKVKPPARPPYRGTARLNPSSGVIQTSTVRKLNDEKDTGKRSMYFKAQAPRNLRITGLSNVAVAIENQTKDTNLRDMFRDSRGKLRGSGIDPLSSDELGSSTTVGHAFTEKASPHRSSSSVSSPERRTSTQQSITLRDNDIGLPVSNIPPSNFSNSNGRIPNMKKPIRKVTNTKGKGHFKDVELEGYIIDGTFVERKCHLTFNETNEVFNIIDSGCNAASKRPNIQIQLHKLLRILWSGDSLKMRLESSRCNNHDHDHIVDIKLHGEKDVADFVREIKENLNIKTSMYSGDHMEKIFEKRLLEQRKFPNTNRIITVEEPLDVQLAAKNLQHREKAIGNDSVERNSPKRRRTLVDNLSNDNDGQRRIQRMQEQVKNESIFHDVVEKPNDVDDEFLIKHDEGLTKMDRLIKLCHPETSNPHLRSSHLQSGSELKDFEDPISAAEGFPQSLRYSKTEGLGPPWKKPLLYPKNGKKKTIVDFPDLERLDEGQFLNDNLIGFYLRFLENQLEEKRPDLAKKVYFFNTFFFASLTNTQERQKLINYEAVQKWTRSVDIFTYDYIVVPINESAHWYVAIICNSSALIPSLNLSDEARKDNAASSPNLDEQQYHNSKSSLDESEGQFSSPRNGGEFVSLVTENSNDQEDPSPSFAEMTLENGLEEPIISENEIHTLEITREPIAFSDVDQGMLNAQIAENMDEPKIQPREEVSRDLDGEKALDESQPATQNQNQQPSALSRKRKRKSVLPIMKHDPNSPTIVTFDSLGLAHTSTTKVLKEYLRLEGRAKRGLDWSELPIKGITAKEIPLQDNFCDCGLFLLGYIDKFLDDPKEFISTILKREYDPETDWPRLNPSDLRTSIRQQIQDLHHDQEAERRAIAIKASKYHGRPIKTIASPSKDSSSLVTEPSDTKDSVPAVSVVIPKDPLMKPLSTELISTRAKALQTALKIDEEEPTYSTKTATEQCDQGVIDVPENDPSIVILDSQSDQPESKLTYEEPTSFRAAKPSPFTEYLSEVKLPSVIQDSQPDSFQPPSTQDFLLRTPQIPSPDIEESPQLIRARSPSNRHGFEESESISKFASPKPLKQKPRENLVIQLD